MERNPFTQKLIEEICSSDFRKQPEHLVNAGRLSARLINSCSEKPRETQHLVWCLFTGVVFGFDDKQWEEMCEAAAEPCGRTGCDCHIQGHQFMQDLTKHRDFVLGRVKFICKQEQEKEELKQKIDFDFNDEDRPNN